ncbi:hypothetical protein OVA19_00185 [Streptomyces sp. SL203]|nr:hypothetical protein [Streptomyces sp. SL203]MCY1649240.1 hypothetical protein [Streptomyces sp. SL203]
MPPNHSKIPGHLDEVGRELADARAALTAALDPSTAEQLINRYTGALFDAVRAWQVEMWGPDYVDPVDGPPSALMTPPPPAAPLDEAAVEGALAEIARQEFPDQD